MFTTNDHVVDPFDQSFRVLERFTDFDSMVKDYFEDDGTLANEMLAKSKYTLGQDDKNGPWYLVEEPDNFETFIYPEILLTKI
jgi:hypothetical protein